MKAFTGFGTLPVLAMFLLIACAPQNKAPAAAPEPVVSEAPAASAQEPWQNKWQDVLRGAKKEGRVVVYIGAGGQIRDTLIKEFTKKHGIEIEALSGNGAEFARRFLSERQAGIYNWDVFQSGNTTVKQTLGPAGVFDPLETALIMPEVTNPKAWWKGDIAWNEQSRLSLGFLAFVSIPVAINTSLVGPGEIKSYNDLLNPRWKGKMTMADPSRAGYGHTMVGLLGDYLMSYDWLKQLAGQEPLIVRDLRLQIDWLAKGKYAIVMSPDSTSLTEFQVAGASVTGIIPREGTNVSAGYGNLAMFNKPPHPNAARLYINWLLSREGQTIYSKAALQQSGRVDIPTDFLPQERIRQPGVKYVDTSSEEFSSRDSEYFRIAQEIFGHLIK